MNKIALWTLVLQTGLLMSMERPNSSFPPLSIAPIITLAAALQNPLDQAASISDNKELPNTKQISDIQVPKHEKRSTSKSLPNGYKGKRKNR